jgi:hypothetical protein
MDKVNIINVVLVLIAILIILVGILFTMKKKLIYVSKENYENKLQNSKLESKLFVYYFKDNKELLEKLNETLNSRIQYQWLSNLDVKEFDKLKLILSFIIRECGTSLYRNPNHTDENKKRLAKLCDSSINKDIIKSFDKDEFCEKIHSYLKQ